MLIHALKEFLTHCSVGDDPAEPSATISCPWNVNVEGEDILCYVPTDHGVVSAMEECCSIWHLTAATPSFEIYDDPVGILRRHAGPFAASRWLEPDQACFSTGDRLALLAFFLRCGQTYLDGRSILESGQVVLAIHREVECFVRNSLRAKHLDDLLAEHNG